MTGSASASIRSSAPRSSSTRRPKRPSNSRSVLPMRKGYLNGERPGASVSEPARAFGRNYPGIDAYPVEPPEQPAVLDLDAAIHNRFQSARTCLGQRGLVPNAELLPEHLGAYGNGILGDRHHVLRLAEHVDDVDLLRHVAQRRIALLAQDLPVARVHRDDAIAVLLHVLGREIARPEPVRGKSDHGDGVVLAEDAPQRVDVVHRPLTIIEAPGLPRQKTEWLSIFRSSPCSSAPLARR